MTRAKVVDPVHKPGYQLEVEDTFTGDELDPTLWIPHYLPQWSSRSASAARYRLGDGRLRLLIEPDQPPWCPEFDGAVRVSSLQTGMYAGPVGSQLGQHRFTPDAVVREPQESVQLYTPQFGFFELRARAVDDPSAMVALWMIGFEDRPEHSAEICLFEIFGRDVRPDRAVVGMGVHPFADPTLVDDFAAVSLPIDVCDFHVYAAEWAPDQVAFFVDYELVRVVPQAPRYPMQFMLNIYAFPDDRPAGDAAPDSAKEFEVDWFRGYRRLDSGA